MSVWDLLKIQPTNEIVHIKAAYAKELKNCRPDQNPEGFQVLHQAYKAALRFAHNNSANEADEADDYRQLQQLQGKSAISEQASISPKNEGEHSPLEQDHLELLNSEYGRHLEKVSGILASNNTRNELNEWRFLLQSELILDPQFNAQLGMFVLDNILRINTDFESQKRNKKRYSQPNSTVKGSTVRYLNDIFHWQGQIQTLRYFFGDDNTRKILNMLEGHDHRSDTQSAIKSVKGGKVSENKSRTVNHAEQYAEALDALEDLKKLTYWDSWHRNFRDLCWHHGYDERR